MEFKACQKIEYEKLKTVVIVPSHGMYQTMMKDEVEHCEVDDTESLAHYSLSTFVENFCKSNTCTKIQPEAISEYAPIWKRFFSAIGEGIVKAAEIPNY